MKRIPICRPIIDEEMIAAASEALRNEMPVNGESVFKFEEEFARYIGVKHAVSTSSGTDALILTLIAAGIKDKEVLTTPFTFVASCNSIIHAGGKPVLVDISQDDCNIDPNQIPDKLKLEKSAILPVHIFGRPCRMNEIMDIAEEQGAIVIEDACQAHGATYCGKRTGGIGDVGCFSFYPTKNMTVGGDGGMVTTDSEDLANAVRKLRDCGRKERYLHDVHGFTSRLNTVNAAIGRVQLRRLEHWNSVRVRYAELYNNLLKDIDDLILPLKNDSESKSVYHLYAARTNKRDALMQWLMGKGIDTAIHYPLPVHLQPAFKSYEMGTYPISEKASLTTISLPMSPGIEEDEIRIVSEAIVEFFGN